jgi:hypothetical protein
VTTSNSESSNPRKPTNYFNELTPEQQEARRELEAMTAEVKRVRKIGEAQRMFPYWMIDGNGQEAVAEGNRKYGYGGSGYVDEDENHYPLPHSNQPRSVRYRRKLRPRKPSIEQLAIARGIIRVHSVNPDPDQPKSPKTDGQ